MKSHYYITILLFFIAHTVFAQDIEFKARASKQQLGVNQRFKITFILNKQGADDFKLPNHPGFKLVGGPMNAFSSSNINGKITVQQSYTYFFEPTKQGILTFPPATVLYNGKTLKSNEIKFDVGKAIPKKKNPNDPTTKAQENIHLVAELSKTSPFVGEGVYVVYRLYVSERVSAFNPRVMKLPKYNGFWNQDIEIKNNSVKQGTYKGEKYRYIELKKVYLIPQKSGKLTIEPMDADLVVEVPTGRVDYWGNAQVHRITQSFSTGKRTVKVKNLPLEGKPSDFTGAVGEFEFKMTSDKENLKANESAKVRVEVKGIGNLKLFELPKITTPDELEVYAPKHKERAFVNANGLQGSVSDTYTVVPEYKGKYKVPATRFSYFSLKDKAYKTIVSKDIIVNMTEGKTVPIVSSSEIDTQAKKADATTQAFVEMQETASFKKKNEKPLFNSKLFYGLLLLPLILIPITVLINKTNETRRQDVVGAKTRTANRLAKKYLSQAKKQLGKKESFYIALEKALHNFLKAKLHVETTDISNEKITALLTQKNVDTQTINAFSNVLSQCDFARFTPTTNLQMQTEYENAKNVLLKLNQQL